MDESGRKQEQAASGPALIDRREAVQRVLALLGGVALVGGGGLLTACDRRPGAGREFTAEDIAFLDEVAETILPVTTTPGAKDAQVGAFIALMVRDTYDTKEQERFREGMRKLDAACRDTHDVRFMEATAAQRLAVLQVLDREQHADGEAREARGKATAARKAAEAEMADRNVPDQRKENSPASGASPAAAITAEAPPHYFRMMKELTLLGYFTSEVGCTKALRYIENPGRFDPCAPYVAGEPAWAPHA